MCASRPHRDVVRVRRVLRGPYRRLILRGERLPPSVAIDLAVLLEEGPSVRFEVPAHVEAKHARALEAYCRSLNAVSAALHLHLISARLQQLKRQQLIYGFGDRCDVETPLDLAAHALPGLENMPATSALASALEDLSEASVEKMLRANGAAPLDECLATFFAAVDQNALRGLMGGDASYLVEASAIVEHGAEGIDLPLLATCLAYEPLADADPASTRRLLDRIRPIERRPARTPEIGNHGLTTRGKLSALLPSYLARDDFEERYLRNELLYFDRRAPALDPQRVLVAWIVDRGEAMRRRAGPSWPRKDSLALRLVALALEDALRGLGSLAAVDLQTAAVLHDGAPKALRGRLIMPRDFEMAHFKRNVEAGGVHILQLPSAFPHYFMREPEWPKEDPFAGAAPSSSAVEGALALLHAMLRVGADPDEADLSVGRLFDVIQINVAHPLTKGLKSPPEERVSSLMSALGPRATLNTLAFDDVGVTWTGLQARPDDGMIVVTHNGSADMTAVLDGLRRAVWRDLLLRMVPGSWA